MSPTTTNPNGQQRKTLAAQIDRLDSMLDNLAEGINDTVVDAVKAAIAQAVREAVHTAVKEVLTNPVLQQSLRSAAAPAREAAVSRKSGVVRGIRRACGWLANVTKGACRNFYAALQWVGRTTKEVAGDGLLAAQYCSRQVCRPVKALLRGIWACSFGHCRLARRVGAIVIVSLGLALVLGIVAFMAGPFLGTLLSSFVTQVLFLATLVHRQVSRIGSGNAAA